MDNNISDAESKGANTSHEYIRDILPFRYRDCLSCGNRTDLACIRCGHCYSCHWKREEVERIRLEDKLNGIFPSAMYLAKKKVPIDNEVQRSSPQRTKRQLIVDVYGRTSEPICNYHGCDHKFTVHGLGNCKCKHPTNKIIGLYQC